MILLSLFVSEYFAGEVAFFLLDGDLFLGAYGDYSKAIDLSMFYYASVATIDLLVWRYLCEMPDKGEREKFYCNLAACSILANVYGWCIYMLDANSQAYQAIMLALLILKMTLLDKALQDAGQYILDFTRRICAGLVCSHTFVYAAEMVKENKKAEAC